LIGGFFVVSHDKAIRELKAYTKVTAHDLPPADFVAALNGESDRGAIILAATMIDDRLVIALQERMPDINSEERARIFGVDGLAGTFANRLKLAQALGIIDRGTRKLIELIREMRNACAHSRQTLTFSTPVIRAAIISMMPDDAVEDVGAWPDHQARDIFCLLCGAVCDGIGGNEGLKSLRSLETMKQYVRDRIKQTASPGKSPTILG
jgi:hypothetical protein